MKTSIETYRADKSRGMTLAAGLAGLLLAAAPVLAQNNDTWTGGGKDGNWETGANWLGGLPPTPGDNLFFGGTVRVNNTNNFPTDTAFTNITIGTPSGFFTLSGNEVALGGNITNRQIVTLQTIALPLLLSNSPSVTVVSNGVLTLSGNISGGNSVTVNGGGTVNLSGKNSFTGGLTVNSLSAVSIGADTNLGSGTLTLNTGTLVVRTNVTLNTNRSIAVGPGFGGISVPAGTNVTYGGIIADNGSPGGLTKSGYGVVDLFGSNTYSGGTSNTIGTLVLDFAQPTSPTNNIINTTSSLELGGGNAGGGSENVAQLILAGGAAPDAQSFNGAFATFGGSAIIATNKTGGTVTLNLGLLSHSPGGTIAFTTPTSNPNPSPGVNFNNITTTSANLNGILGGYALMSSDNNAVTVVSNGVITHPMIMGTNFAAVDTNGNIINYTGYLPVSAAGGTIANQIFGNPEPNIHINDTAGNTVVNVDSDNNNTKTDVNAIKWTTAPTGGGYDGISIGQGNTLRLGQFGGILRNAGPNNTTVTIGGNNGVTQSGSGLAGTANIGTLTAGGPTINTPGEIVCINNITNETTGTIIFESSIADNGSGSVTFVKMGPGSIKIDGNNTYSGGLYLLQGRVQFAGSEIGNANPTAGGTGSIFVLPGAYLFPSGIGTGIISNNISVAGNGDTSEPLGAFRGGTYAGTTTLIGDANFGGGATFDGPIVGPYSLTLGSAAIINGGVTLNTNNNWTGNTVMTARNNTGANVITCGAVNAIPSGFGYGNVSLVGFSTGTIAWDLHGFNQTINGLSSTSAGSVSNTIIESLTAPATLTVGNNDQSGTFAGVIVDAAGGGMSLTKIGGGVETLTAANVYAGATIVNGGTLAFSGSGEISSSSSITVNSGATLDISADTAFATANPVALAGATLVGNGSVGALTENNGTNLFDISPNVTNVVATALSLGGSTNILNINSVSGVASYPTSFPIIKYSGALSGTLNYGIGTVPNAATGGFFSNDVPDSIIYLVLTNGPAPETWTGADSVNPTFWDFVTTNWIAFKGTPAAVSDAFGPEDPAIFDDTASTGNVVLQTNLNPSFVTFSNTALAYTLTGPGSIFGVAGMAKYGTNTVTLDDIGNDTFTKGVAVNQGTLIFATNNSISGGVSVASGATAQVGQNTGFGNLPAGNVTDNGIINFDIGTNATAGNSFGGGTGAVIKTDASILTFSGNNAAFPGTIGVSNGVLRAGSGSAFGTNTTTVLSGATVDVNGQTLNTAQVIASGTGVGGLGAIVNNGAGNANGLDSVTLTGNTTIGGTNRWDIRGNVGATTLSTGGNGYNLVKAGANYFSIANAAVDSALANIDVQQGTLEYNGDTSGLGASGSTLTVENGATFALYQATNLLNKVIVLNDVGTNDALLVPAGGGGSALNNIIGNITVNGTNIWDINSGTSLGIQSIVSGPSGIIKIGGGNVTLSVGESYAGNTVLSNGAWTVDAAQSSPVGIYSNATLAGMSSIAGAVTNFPGGTISPGDPALQAQATLSPQGGLTLETNSTTVFELSSSSGGVNDQVAVTGNLNLIGTNNLKILPLSFMNVGDIYTLFTFSGSSNGTPNVDLTNLFTLQPPTNGFFGFTMLDPTNNPGTIQIKVTKAVGNDVWASTGSTAWDTSSLNWSRNGNPTLVSYNLGDQVTFTDPPSPTGSAITNVNITSGFMTVSLFTENAFNEGYNIGGTGGLAGITGINLQGYYLMISCSNIMSGPNTIGSSLSVLQLGNNTTNGSLGTGPLTNSGTLVLDRSDLPVTNTTSITNFALAYTYLTNTLVVPGAISGSGSISNAGSGLVTLSGANTYTGPTIIAAGTLAAEGATALGSTNGAGIVVSNGATLDISNNVQVFQELITASGSGVGGNGAIVNFFNSTTFTGNAGNWENLTMTGDLTIGGNGRMDMRSLNSTNYATGGPGAAMLSTGGNPYNLIKVGSNQMQFANVVVDSALSNIYVGGSSPSLISFQGLDTVPMLGNPAGSIIISNGGNFQLYDASNAVTKFMTIQDGGEFSNGHGTNEFDGPITFTSGTNHWNRIDAGGTSLVIANQISGPGSLLKTTGNTLYLSLVKTNSVGEGYSNTLVQAGQLALLDNVQLTNSPIILVSNGAMLTVTGAVNSLTLGTLFPQTLGGTGTIVGDVTEDANSLVYPSLYRTNNPGNLTFSNTTVLNGTVQLGLNRNVSPNNDEIVASGGLTVSGPLVVTNFGPDLHVGDHFVLFSVPVSGFSSISLPTNPTNNPSAVYQWQTNLAVDGSITLTNIFVSSPTTNANITKVFLSGGNIVVQGTNNNVPNTSFHWIALTSTNIAKPLTTWTPISTNTFVAGGTNFFYTNPIAPLTSGTNRLFIDIKVVP